MKNGQDQLNISRGSGKSSGIPGMRVRIWPAVLIVVVAGALILGVSPFASTIIHNVLVFMVTPFVAMILLTVWWLRASRTPRRDRLIGLALFVAALLLVLLTQRSLMNGALLLMYALPALSAIAVLAMAVTLPFGWRIQRWFAAATMLLAAGAFTLFRVNGLGGTFLPVMSFRWEPISEELLSEPPQLAGGGTALLPAEAGAGDWPGFRGPSRDGRVTGITFSPDWSTPPRQLWRRRVGIGWSSFAVVGEYVFTQEQHGESELVTCYRAATGENVWVNRVDAFHEDPMGSGPRATPVFNRGRLYTQGATGVLQCLDAATGTTIWRKDLKTEMGVKMPNWGFSATPLVMDELIVVGAGDSKEKSLIAFQSATGEIVWSAGDAANGYSSPHLADIAGFPQVLILSDFGLKSFDLETGDPLWEHMWKLSGNPRCVQPLVVGSDLVMMGSAGTLGSRLLRIQRRSDTWEVREEWTTRRFRPYFNDSVLHKGYCYGFDGDRLLCINIKTGDRLWEGKRYGGQVLLVADIDMLLVLSEKGVVTLVEATPTRFNEVASFQALTGKTWNHPVVAHGKLFVRNADEAACFALPEAQSL